MSGLQVLFPEPGATVSPPWVHQIDIIFVHGLNPYSKANHAEDTWTHETGFMWPRDALPAHVPGARIMLYSYNTHVARDVSEAGIREHANTLLDLTHSRREEADSDVPLVFVGHSLGGLVIKQALLQATHNHRVYGTIRNSTRAFVFFGVPHRGGNGAVIGHILAKSVSLFSGAPRNDLVDNLKKSSKYLARTSVEFSHQLDGYEFLSIIETWGPLTGPIRMVVVDYTAATLGLAEHHKQVLKLDRDHHQICKLEQGSDLDRVLQHMKRITGTALTKSALRDQQPATAETSTIPEVIAKTNTDIQITGTLDFRLHTQFHGREQLLDDIQAFLVNSGPQTLLVHGPAGIGKSTLVHEAVYRNKDRCSVFWFAAQNSESLQRGFDLASYVVAPDSRNIHLPNTHNDLITCLESEKAGSWILVFDNVSRGLNPLTILPKGLNNGKIVIISRDSDVLSSTSVTLSVPELSNGDGCQIFLSLWEAQSSRQRQAIRNLSELEQTIGRLSGRVLTVVLAAECAGDMPPNSIVENISDFEAEETSPASHMDGMIWKWFNLAMESLSPKDVTTLRLLSLFDHTYLSDRFLELLKGSIKTAAGLAPYANDLLSQHRDTHGSYLCIEPAVHDCIQYYQEYDLDRTKELLEIGAELFAAAWSMMVEKSFSEQQAMLETAAPHMRTLCLNLARHHCTLSSQHNNACLDLTIYLLGKCIDEASHLQLRKRVTRGFWPRMNRSKIWYRAKATHERLRTQPVLVDAKGREQMTIHLIHLVRQGVMELKPRRTLDVPLSARRMVYWTLQAEQAQTGWGARDPSVSLVFEYADQDGWDESRIYMDMESGEWPVC